MVKLLRKFGKPFLGLFFVAVVLLVGRASLELMLPAMMSDIVDVGIGQGGIDLANYTPEQVAQFATSYYGSVNFDERLTNQLAVRYLQAHYEAAGTDMRALQMDYVWSRGGLMILFTLLAVTAAVTQGFVSSRISTGLARNLRRAIFKKVTSFNLAEYNQFSTASLITRSTNDVNQIQALMAMAVRIVIFSPILGIGGILMVMGTDASMVWVIALTIGLMMAFVVIYVIIAMPKFKIIQKLIDKINLVTRESLTGMMVVRAFNAQDHETDRFDTQNKNLRRTNLFLARISASAMPFVSLIMGLSYVLIIWVGGASINAGNIAIGDMMAFITYTMFIVWSFLMVSMVVMQLPRAQVAARRILEIVETPDSICDPENPEKISSATCDIVFENVDFKFAGATGNALTNISFTAKAGEMTAFVGSTGAGKTALVNLIPRFYDATAGKVTIGGVNVKNVAQEDLRNLIGYIPQKALLFSGTIETNIKYAGEVDDAHMQKAANIAQATEFIKEKPEGFKDEISQGGTNVSGGQRQRLSIARAIAKNPQIYIFDDSFSALDYKTDMALRSAIAEEIGQATLLIVAQRINTIKNADKIIVLDEGKVVGAGTHSELLRSCDVYKQIATSQLSREEMAKELGSVDGGAKDE